MKQLNKSNFNNGLTLKILKAFRLCLKHNRTIIIKNRKGAEILKAKFDKINKKFILVDLKNNTLINAIMHRFATNNSMLSFIGRNISFNNIQQTNKRL